MLSYPGSRSAGGIQQPRTHGRAGDRFAVGIEQLALKLADFVQLNLQPVGARISYMSRPAQPILIIANQQAGQYLPGAGLNNSSAVN